MLQAEVVALETNSNSNSPIVTEALSWLGVRYHHMADVKLPGKLGGVDCAMFLVRVFVDTGIVPAFDPRPYAPDFYLHTTEERYLGWVRRYGSAVEIPQPGDVALFQFGRAIGHGGIYIGNDTMVHADRQAGAVVLTNIVANPYYYKRFRGFWRVNSGPV